MIQEMTVADKMAKIKELKERCGAIILSHFYTRSEVQEVADFVGDSLALAVEAKKTTAPVLLFAGVHFMAETAKLLSADKRVLIPALEAGCSLADSCTAAELKKFREENPEYMVVSYVNTSVDVKSHTDICCTSSNALKVINSIDKDQPILFVPDRNLGGYLKRITGRENMKLWDGFCHVHEAFDTSIIDSMKKVYPGAEVVVHPECKKAVADMANYIGSTAGIIDYCRKSDCQTFIVVTEQGILSELTKTISDKKFIALDMIEADECTVEAAQAKRRTKCAVCDYMKMITLDNIIEALENQSPEVILSDETLKTAHGCIDKMLAL